ncbi:hypothetical protein [Streptomyces sedi]|uniref:hypothetical protein n=1 Tax=Streptomyces TaxID=1883 RepID=UPI00147688FB
MDLLAEPGLSLTDHAAEPGSADEERLHLLASWSATTAAAAAEAAVPRDGPPV